LNRALGLKTELTGSTWTNESNVLGSKLIETLGWHDDADAPNGGSTWLGAEHPSEISLLHFSSTKSLQSYSFAKRLKTFTMSALRASPTVWQLGLAFLFFAKNLKFSYPTVWQLGLAFLSTWQTPVVSAHICARSVRLAIDSARYSGAISPPRARSFPSRAAGFVSRETPGL